MLKLTVNNLSKRFGQRNIFSKVSFELSEGVFGIAGPNGSGKSTLLKCLSRLLRPTKGSIQWIRNNNEILPLLLKDYLGYAAPYVNHYPELTCRENLKFICNLRSIDSSEKRIEEILKFVGIAHKTDELFGNLSSGQQQRIKLAGAIIHSPEILMLDEPGTNLDRKGHELIEQISQLWSAKKKLLIIATNDPQELELCDKIIHIDNFSEQKY